MRLKITQKLQNRRPRNTDQENTDQENADPEPSSEELDCYDLNGNPMPCEGQASKEHPQESMLMIAMIQMGISYHVPAMK